MASNLLVQRGGPKDFTEDQLIYSGQSSRRKHANQVPCSVDKNGNTLQDSAEYHSAVALTASPAQSQFRTRPRDTSPIIFNDVFVNEPASSSRPSPLPVEITRGASPLPRRIIGNAVTAAPCGPCATPMMTPKPLFTEPCRPT